VSVLQVAARGVVEQIVLSLGAGTLVSLCAWLALRVAPARSSRARFMLWFGVLLAIAILPLLATGRPAGISEGPVAASHAWISIPESWALYIFGLWVVVASAGLARVVAGLLQVGRVRGRCESIRVEELPASVRESLARFASRRTVRVCLSDAVRVPTAIGFFNPVVVIPRWLFAELPEPQLNQVVLHELAHLARWDDWTNLAQKILRAVMFFHPAVWWIDQRLSLEREMACDDAVVAATEDRTSYAQCLAMLAEKTLGRRRAAMAQAAVHKIQQVTARVMRILDPPSATSRGGWAWAVATVSTIAVGSTIALGGGGQWIAFRAPETMVASAPRPSTAILRPRIPASATVVQVGLKSEKAVSKHAAVRRHVAPAPQSRNETVVAKAQSTAPAWLSQTMTSPVVPVKATQNVQPQAGDVMVWTVFSSAAGNEEWNLQIWHVTVYVPAKAKTPDPAPRKTT
jgi:beta-lactamase regulating signal transducer with metallopeptidase domain